jgi:signal peptidase II
VAVKRNNDGSVAGGTNQGKERSCVSVDGGGRIVSKGVFFSWKAHVRLWIFAGLGLAADLFSKSWILRNVGDSENGYLREPIVLIPDYLRLFTTFNPGAAWSVGAGKTGLLITASILGFIFLVWFFSTTRPDQWLVHCTIGILIAGDLGNLYDRIFNDGKVVDFIEVNLHFWPANPWPIFNIADMLLCIGVGILLLSMFFAPKQVCSKQS